MKKHYLFICTSGIDRSSAAANIFENSEKIEARSAGFFPYDSSKEITKEKINWASTIFVMNEQTEFHKTQLLKRFPETKEKEIIILGIPNDFKRHNEELDRLLKVKLERFGFLNITT